MQERAPLIVVGGASGLLTARQQQVILHIEDARGAVGTLEVSAEPREVPGLVAWHRALNHAAREMRAVLDPIKEATDLLSRRWPHARDARLEPRGVDRLPDFRRQRSAHRSRVLARRAHAVIDTRRILAIEHHERERTGRSHVLVAGAIEAHDTD